jgi:DNA-binding SARP family transcriptional activator/tetratricopeptide (TPR) repeat protein
VGENAPIVVSPAATRVRLLGSLRVTIAGHDVGSRLGGTNGRLAFAFLVINRGRALARNDLIEALWPEDQPASPLAALSTVLARLRRELGADVLPSGGPPVVSLPEDATVDVEIGEKHLRTASQLLDEGEFALALDEARAAHEVLSAPLLPDLQRPWLEDRRREFAEASAQALEVLAGAALALGGNELVTARGAARRLIESEPYRESGYMLLMKTHVQVGNDAEALRVYEGLRVRLRDELGTRPSGAVARLHERVLLNEWPAAASPPPLPVAPKPTRVPLPSTLAHLSSGEYVGRDSELAALARGWEDAVSGRSALALVAGEPGIGKTALAARFAQHVHAGGATVLFGQCDEQSVVPYQPITQALRSFCRRSSILEEPDTLTPQVADAGRLVPELRDRVPGAGGEREPERYRLFDAVTVLLQMSARNGPALLVLDDLHWADPSTLQMLRHIVRNIDGTRLMVLATYRDTDIGQGHPLLEALAELDRDRPFERLPLARLEPEESAQLIAAYLGEPPEAGLAERWYERTEGHPLFLQEGLRRPELVVDADAGELPRRISDLILRRVAQLEPERANQLALASVVGLEFDLDVLAALAEASEDAVLASLEDAIERGLVVESSVRADSFRFSHVLIRDALYRRYSRTRRSRLHRRVGEALEHAARQRPAAELAHHFFVAHDVVKTVRYATRAADAAFDALAYEEAASHCERALEALADQGESADPERSRLLLRLGNAQRRAGQADVERTFQRVVESARDRGDAEQLALAALGGRHYESGERDDARVALLEEALTALGDADSVLRVRVLARLAEALHFAEAQERALTVSREGMEVAQRLGEPDAMIAALLGRHAALLHVAHVDERLDVLRRLVALAGAIGDHELAAHGWQWTVYARFESGDFAGGRQAHATFAALVKELRQPRYEHAGLGWQALFAQLDGELELTERLAQEAFALAERVQGLDPMALFAAQLFFVRREQDRLEELLPIVEAFVAANDVPRWRAVLVVTLAAVGQSERARAGLWAFNFKTIPRDLWWLTTIALLAEACALVGDDVPARDLHELLAPHAERSVQVVFASHLGSVERCLGLLATAAGEWAAAATHFEAALRSHRAAAARALIARTCCDYARSLALAGESERTEALLAEALEQARDTDLITGVEAAVRRVRVLT